MSTRLRWDPRNPFYWEFCNMWYGAANTIHVWLAQSPQSISNPPWYWPRLKRPSRTIIRGRWAA